MSRASGLADRLRRAAGVAGAVTPVEPDPVPAGEPEREPRPEVEPERADRPEPQSVLEPLVEPPDDGPLTLF